MTIVCHVCGLIPEDGNLDGWQSKTYTSQSGFTFTEWFCPSCSEDSR